MSNFETARPLITVFIFASPGLWLSSCLLVVSLTGGRAKAILPNSLTTFADWRRDSLLRVHAAFDPVVDIPDTNTVDSCPFAGVFFDTVDGQYCRLF